MSSNLGSIVFFSMSSATLRTIKSFVSHTPDGKTRSPKMLNSPSSSMLNMQPASIYKPHSVLFSTKRKIFDKGNAKRFFKVVVNYKREL